jgi:Zn-dependent protease with chaperone function
MKTTAYRYPFEHLILGLTLLLVAGVIALTAIATVCSSALFILAFIFLSFSIGRSQHQALLSTAQRVTPGSMPAMTKLIQLGKARLQPGDVQVYVVPSKALNAYTFGLTSPKVVVLYSALFKVMDEDELLFIFGHELGHVALGHTWLNSLVGGMAGIPSSWGAGTILAMAFLWWNRTCELSADRAGLLACGKPEKAVTALIKLGAGLNATTRSGMELAYRQIDAEDDTLLGSLGETLSTHPMLIRRINELRRYAASAQYQRLLAQVSGNAGASR